MIVKIHGEENTAAFESAKALVLKLGHSISSSTIYNADLAIAPLLTRILSEDVLEAPVYGTLIFHLSPLPYGRGASAIQATRANHSSYMVLG